MRHLLFLSALAVTTACSKSEPPASASQAELKPAPSAPAAAPTPSIEDTTFKLALVSQGEYTAGAPASASVVLEARGGYHVNQEYPMKVELKAPAQLKLGKTTLQKGDASELGEHKALFQVPFSAEPGVHQLTADVDFAVCTAETCVPDQRTVAVALTVK